MTEGVHLACLEVFHRRQRVVPAHACHFNEQGLAGGFQLLGAALHNVIPFNHARFDGVQQIFLPLLGLLDLEIDGVDAFLLIVLGGFDALAQLHHEAVQAFRRQDFFDQPMQYLIVELLHRQVGAGARVVAVVLAAGAFVIFVTAALAGDQRQAVPADAAR